MNIVIWGAGKAGNFIYSEIKDKRPDIKVMAFIDNNVETVENDGINVYKPDDFFLNYKEKIDAVIMAAGAQKTVSIMLTTLTNYRIKEIYMFHDIAGKCRISPFKENGEIDNTILHKIKFCNERPTIPYLEIPITDKCNLNCKGCLFACNGNNEEKDIPYEQLKKDALRVEELFCEVTWIRILGGEPLLHSDIKKLLKMYRKVFPDSEIDLCTNGLLFMKMDDEFFDILKSRRISVHISGYKPVYENLEKINNILCRHDIAYTVLKREEFAKYYTLKNDNDKYRNCKECFASECRELYNGRILKCSAVIAFEKLNKKYGTEYVTKKSVDWFDIHENGIDANEIKKQMSKACDVCSYCNIDKTEFFKWDYAFNGNGLKDYIL